MNKGYINSVCESKADLNLYKPIFKKGTIDRLLRTAESLQGKTWLNINTSCFGGGVGENLSVITPFANSLGINTEWYVHDGRENFFVATKKIHDNLQGLPHTLMKQDLENYFGSLRLLAEKQTFDAEFTVVHDYQLAPLSVNRKTMFTGSIIWSSHLETSSPTSFILKLLLPLVQRYDGALFAHRDYIFQDLKCPVFQMCPAIDPLHPKNNLDNSSGARDIASQIPELINIDLERKIILACSRFDIHKNLEGNIEAFNKYKELADDNPILIIVGDSSTMDDPECKKISYKIKELASRQRDIYVVENPKQTQLGALMTLAKVFLHLAKKEGFGRVITESLWHGTPAITSDNPGVRLQVKDNLTGFIVRFDDYDSAANRIAQVVGDETLQRRLGRSGHRHVKNNFLIDSQVEIYLGLMNYFINKGKIPKQYKWGLK